MRLRVIKTSNVTEPIGTDKFMMKCFNAFFVRLELVDWQIPQNITQTFKSADLITCADGQLSRVVFNIGRNRYRLICGYLFGRNEVVLFVKFVGTHKEYDNVNV